MRAYIVALLVVLGLGPASAQQRPNRPPPTDRLIEVLASSLFSPDDGRRLETATWFGVREIPSASAILNRLSKDPSPEVRHQAALGLARIAQSHELSRFQIRSMSATQRALLVRQAAQQGLIGVGLLETIASDETASARERAEALIALEAIEKTSPHFDRWVALIGCDVDAIRLLAALMTVSQAPDTAHRSVRLARDFASAELKHATEAAARGDVAPIIEALHLASRTSPAALSEWCTAIIRSCDPNGSPAVRLVRREALRARLRCAPEIPGSKQIWEALWSEAEENAEVRARLTRWTLEIVCDARRDGRAVPGWLGDPVVEHGRSPESRLIGQIARAGVGEPHAFGVALAGLVNAPDPSIANLAWSAVRSLAEPRRTEALRLIIESAGPGLSDARLRWAARELLRCDPVGAQQCLTGVAPSARPRVNSAYVLAGAGVELAGSGDRLELLAALCRAETAISGEPTADGLELASVLEVLALDRTHFEAPMRAEAAWLALVLRDQGSEALAHLPHRPPASDKEFSQGPSDADRLSPWAQMQYP